MKGLSGGRPAHLQLTSPTSSHTCGFGDVDHSFERRLHRGDSRPPSYLLSPTESCPLEGRHRFSPRSSIHSECMVVPVSMGPADHSVACSTFPRMHYGSVPRDGGGPGYGGSSSHGGKTNRIPANLLDQFEKQKPLHRDGFHTLQYQRASTTTTTTTTNSEQRNESPGRIRHLVHSVQKLFTKSHSLEGSSKMNGTKSDSHHHHHHQGHHKHNKRSKSKDRKGDGSARHRSAGWWSSDDNLDSDSTYRPASVMSRHPADQSAHCYPESLHGHLAGDLSLKTSKSNNDVKCSACESVGMAPDGKIMKRSSWSTLTVSQAKEAFRKSSLNLEKPMTPMDLKANLRPCHFLQVPQDEWAGYPGDGKDEEIPCRRMRSSSYVKAMGDEESGESDSSPKTSPHKSLRPDALIKAVIRPRELLDSHLSSYRLDKINSDVRNYISNFAADLSQSYHLQSAMHPSISLDPSAHYNSPKFRSRNQSYMRAVSTLSQASCVSQVSETGVNGQFESVCESVFGEMESQAMDALDLPGCFRTRSHSYVRAIQAGYSQDDDCVAPMTSTVASTIRSSADRNYVQEDSCFSEPPRPYEDFTADTVPLTHDHLGCPVRRDKTYRQDNAVAKPMSGPAVSPVLFRSPRPAVAERPSPKAIQASIKESATLAAAISMQWKEEVSAMRLELAQLRRDLCQELRAFNSNFDTFTKHYNTWSPQSCKIPGEVASGATQTRSGACGGPGDQGFGTPEPDRSTTLAQEKAKRVSTVSVGTQARSKVLVRQSTADAAVNCPEEKEKLKGARKNLPKQLSMDPSILTRPQSMYVESAIPLSLEPIKPFFAKVAKTKPLELSSVKPETQPDLREEGPGSSYDAVATEPPDSDGKGFLAEMSPEKIRNVFITLQQSFDNEPDSIEFKSEESDYTETQNIQLPYPVPVLMVSPPDDHDDASDSELDLVGDNADQTTNVSSEEFPNSTVPREPDVEPIDLPGESMADWPDQNQLLDLDAPTVHKDPAQCPSIVVTECFDINPPESPTDSDPNPDPIASNTRTGSVFGQAQPDSTSSSGSTQTRANAEPESEDSEWPPLPEPLDNPPMYHADLVHFDLVMLTSLDQEDLDSVFMDPEPEPFDPSTESVFELDGPCGRSDSSQISGTDPSTVACPSDQSSATDPVNLDPSSESDSDSVPLGGESGWRKTQVTVTISPPSSLSPDTSSEMDFGPPKASPEPWLPDDDPDDVGEPFVGEASTKPGEIGEGSSNPTENSQVIAKETTTESLEETFLWYRWQKRTQKKELVQRSASVELWSGRYEYNSAEITYVSLTL
ncbi:uncharacterized protein dlgap2a isoform X1 [Stigmatopora argus]